MLQNGLEQFSRGNTIVLMEPRGPALRAEFRSLEDAQNARGLVLATTPAVTVSPPVTESDPRFIVRFLVIVVLASVAGTALGVVLGLLLIAIGVTPNTTDSLVLQVVTWAVFWHLLIGMIAGYVLLADRTSPEWAPARTVTLAIRTTGSAGADEIERMLKGAGATKVSRSTDGD